MSYSLEEGAFGLIQTLKKQELPNKLDMNQKLEDLFLYN